MRSRPPISPATPALSAGLAMPLALLEKITVEPKLVAPEMPAPLAPSGSGWFSVPSDISPSFRSPALSTSTFESGPFVAIAASGDVQEPRVDGGSQIFRVPISIATPRSPSLGTSIGASSPNARGLSSRDPSARGSASGHRLGGESRGPRSGTSSVCGESRGPRSGTPTSRSSTIATPAPSIPQARREFEIARGLYGYESLEANKCAMELALQLEEDNCSTEEAGDLLRECLECFERLLGVDHIETLRVVNNLAVYLDNLGELEDALTLYHRASDGRRRHLGAEHPHTLDALYNYGTLLTQLGARDESAEEVMREVRDGCLRAFGETHHGSLESAARLVELLQAREHAASHAEAADLCRSILAGREASQGKSHEETLQASVKVAAALASAGLQEDAEEAHRNAIKRHTDALGLDDPVTLELTYNFAVYLSYRGQDIAAETVLVEALTACEQALGSDSSAALSYVDDLAIMLETRNRPSEAEPLFRRALASRRRTMGELHKETLRSVSNLAVFLDNQGQQEEALRMYRTAHTGRAKILGKAHPKTIDSVLNLTMFLASRGDDEESLGILGAAIAGLERSDPRVGRSIWTEASLVCMGKMAEILKKLGRHSEAEVFFRKVREVWLSSQQPPQQNALSSSPLEVDEADGSHSEDEQHIQADGSHSEDEQHIQAADAAYNLALCIALQGRYSDAEPLFLEAADEYGRANFSDDPYSMDVVFNLADCLKEQGRLADADPLFQRAAEGRLAMLGPDHRDTIIAEEALRSLRATLPNRAAVGEVPRLVIGSTASSSSSTVLLRVGVIEASAAPPEEAPSAATVASSILCRSPLWSSASSTTLCRSPLWSKTPPGGAFSATSTPPLPLGRSGTLSSRHLQADDSVHSMQARSQSISRGGTPIATPRPSSPSLLRTPIATPRPPARSAPASLLGTPI